jgi:hypothetical protein
MIAEAAGNILGGIATGIGTSSAAKQAAAASRYGADMQNKIAERELNARLNAYNSMLGTAGGLASSGEQAFLQESSQTAPEVQQRQLDILGGQAEDLNNYNQQLQSSLAQQGLRGGQAANQLKRGIGEQAQTATRDINQLLSQDAMQRQSQRMAYQQQKAQIGQQGLTSLY